MISRTFFISSQLSKRYFIWHKYCVVSKYLWGDSCWNVLNECRHFYLDICLISVKMYIIWNYLKLLTCYFDQTLSSRVLDASTYEKLHRALAVNLGKYCLNLVENAISIDMDMLKALCSATLTEYAKSSLKDRVYKVS